MFVCAPTLLSFRSAASRAAGRVSALLVALLLSCAAQSEQPLATPAARPPLAVRAPSQPAPPQQLAAVAPGTAGPFLGRYRDHWLAVWAEPQGGAARWMSREVSRDGLPLGAQRELGPAPEGVRLLGLVPVQRGLLVLYSAELEQQQQLGTWFLAEDGKLAAASSPLTRTPNAIVWVDAVVAGSQPLVLWGERSGPHAVLFAAALSAPGVTAAKSLEPEIHQVHAAAAAWQVAPLGAGALLAAVTLTGRVELIPIAANGEAGAARPGAAQAAYPDLDLIATETGYLAAYSEQQELQRRIVFAPIDAEGRWLPPQAARLPLRGEQRLLRLLPGAPGFAVYKNQQQEPHWLRVAQLTPDAAAQELLIPELPSHPAPEFAPLGAGLAALFWDCAGAPECRAERYPVVLRTRQGLQAPRSDRWLRAGTTPELVWGLNCAQGTCLGLSATGAAPAAVHTHVTATGRDTSSARAAGSEALLSLQAHSLTPELADLAWSSQAQGGLLAWLSDFDPSRAAQPTPVPDGRAAPGAALLKVQWVPASGMASAAEPLVVSYRASSLGGVSFSRSGDRTLLVWSAQDGKHPQVFTTLLTETGKRVNQAVQTTKPGDVLQVVSAALEPGWLVGWIDDRHGAASAYVEKVGPGLRRLTPDLEVFGAPTAAAPVAHGGPRSPALDEQVTGMAASAHGQQAWVLVSTVNGKGISRLGLQRLGKANLERLGEPMWLRSTQDHAESPQLVTFAGRHFALWLEGQAGKRSAWGAELDAEGTQLIAATRLSAPASISALSNACDAQRCTLWLSAEHNDGPVLLSGELTQLSAITWRPSVRVSARSALGVRAVGTPEELWYHDSVGTRFGVLRALFRP